MPASSIDITGAKALLENIGRQAPYALAIGLTAIAQDAQRAVQQKMPTTFDRPTPFTRAAIGILPATTALPVAQVFVKDMQAGYLGIEETGGTRLPRPGAPVIVPADIGVNAYGNIPRGALRRLKTRTDVFVATGKTPQTQHLPPGIYQRAATGERRDGSRGVKGALRLGAAGRNAGGAAFKGQLTSLKLLTAFETHAAYKPLFGFVETVRETVSRVAGSRLGEAIVKALATARRR